MLTHREGGIGKLEWLLPKMGYEIDLRVPPYGDPFPSLEHLSDYRALFIMGSSNGVYDYRHQVWIRDEMAWVTQALDTGIPTWGICFGCQLLAYIHGGTVAMGSKGVSFGYERLTVLEDDPIFGRELGGRMVFDSHNDTYTLTQSAVHLGSNNHYAQQAAKFRKNVYGVQFHPEKDPGEIEEVYKIRQREGRLPPVCPPLEDLIAAGQKDEHIVEMWMEKFIKRLLG